MTKTIKDLFLVAGMIGLCILCAVAETAFAQTATYSWAPCEVDDQGNALASIDAYYFEVNGEGVTLTPDQTEYTYNLPDETVIAKVACVVNDRVGASSEINLPYPLPPVSFEVTFSVPANVEVQATVSAE